MNVGAYGLLSSNYKEETPTSPWDWAHRGVLSVGFSSAIADWRVDEEQTFESVTDEHNRGILNQGIINLSYAGFLKIGERNQGVVLTGGRCIVQCNRNDGVIISGNEISTDAEGNTAMWENVIYEKIKKEKTVISGSGIYIHGGVPSLIQGSTSQTSPTTLKGYFKLDSMFQLKDSTGTVLIDTGKLKQIINTISNLEERVSKLETNQMNSMSLTSTKQSLLS